MSEIAPEVIDRMMVRCGRRCCIYRRFRPTKLQAHHIIERNEGGEWRCDQILDVTYAGYLAAEEMLSRGLGFLNS